MESDYGVGYDFVELANISFGIDVVVRAFFWTGVDNDLYVRGGRGKR